MSGGGEMEVDGETMPLDEDHMVRVGPAAKRKVWAGPEGIRVARTAAAQRLVELRDGIRAEKRFQDADKLRAELMILGVVLQDAATGTSWDLLD